MVTDPSPPPQILVPKACQACAHTKSKCVPYSGNGGKCERCHRLGKECKAQIPVPRRPRRPRPTRTAKLEEKLDGIVLLLTNANAPRNPPTVVNPPHVEAKFQISVNPKGGIPTPPFEYASALNVTQQPTAVEAFSKGMPSFIEVGEDEDALFGAYQSYMAVHFPFVIIEPTITAERLYGEKPLLHRVILMVAACRSMFRQMTLREEVMQDIMSRILIKNEKSLELLQGILLFIAWFHYHLPLLQLTNLSQLAIAISYDLGLNKPPSNNAKYEVLVEESKCANERLMKRDLRTLDERRAYLGVFWLQSAIFPYLGKIEPMDSTPYIEECCSILESSQQYASDVYLIQLVRLQIIVGKIRRNVPSVYGIDALLVMYMNSLQVELQQLKATLPIDNAQSQLLLLSIHGAECSIFELGLHSAPAHLVAAEHTYRQLETLHRCLASTKSFLETYLSIPVALYWTLPISFFAQGAHVVIILSKLTLFDGDGWDVHYVRSYLDLSVVLQQMTERFEDAGKAFKVDPVTLEHNDTFSRVARKTRRFAAWYGTRCSSESKKENIDLQNGFGANPSAEVTAGGEAECFLDDAFWLDIMSDWDALQ